MSKEQWDKKHVVFQGKIFVLEQYPQADGRVFEVARRAPGVRLIIADKKSKKLLLTKEYRRELEAWDYRLPGGKVFDTLQEYEQFLAAGQDMLVAAQAKAQEEAGEEAGIDAKELKLFKKSTLGTTVEWDLYIFEATAWQPHKAGQHLGAGERIESDSWFDYAATKDMILNGHMQEDRVALILLQWLNRQKG